MILILRCTKHCVTHVIFYCIISSVFVHFQPTERCTTVPIHPIPRLARININEDDPDQPVIVVFLDREYPQDGELRTLARKHHAGYAQATEEQLNDGLYLICDRHSAANNALLAALIETMHFHDYTGDGIPDCGNVIAEIERALPDTRETPLDFRHPFTGYFGRLVMSIMPPPPSSHIVMGYGRLQERMQLRHYLTAFPLIIMIIGLISLQTYFLSWTKYSAITGFTTILEKMGVPNWAALALFVGLIIGGRNYRSRKPRQRKPGTGAISQHTIGFFNGAAVLEEQTFREGSENWTTWQRCRSCIAFGLIHLGNLFYPLASVLPLALGGALFMAVYLRKYHQTKSRRLAVLSAAVWHRTYNRLALAVMVVSVAVWFGIEAIGLLAVVLALVVGTHFFAAIDGRRKQGADESEAMITK